MSHFNLMKSHFILTILYYLKINDYLCVIKTGIKLRIGVNTRLLLKGKLEGIGYFQQQILFRMVKSHPQDEFVFFFDRKYDTDFVFAKNVIPVVIPLPARHPLLWVLYFDYLLPLYIKKYKIDIFFSPENYIPGNCKIPTVCTIHDLNFYHNGKYIGDNWHQRYFMKYFPLNARKSDKIITVSNFSKDDISSSFGIDKSDIEVVYNASNPVYSPKPEAINISFTLWERYTDVRIWSISFCPLIHSNGRREVMPNWL